MTGTHLAVFKGKKIRRTLHNNEWWFVIADVVAVRTQKASSGLSSPSPLPNPNHSSAGLRSGKDRTCGGKESEREGTD
jgi:hypothetical protein